MSHLHVCCFLSLNSVALRMLVMLIHLSASKIAFLVKILFEASSLTQKCLQKMRICKFERRVVVSLELLIFFLVTFNKVDH